MRMFLRKLERLLTLAAIYLLLAPAIVFASLIIGMTGEAEIGQSMLITLFLLLVVILVYRRTYARPSRRSPDTVVIEFTREGEDNPPPLSGIYWDLYEEQRELERLNGFFQGSGAEPEDDSLRKACRAEGNKNGKERPLSRSSAKNSGTSNG